MEGRMGVAAKNLAPGATFDVTVQGVRIGSLTTNGRGGGRARFRTSPRGHDQLLGVDPRGKKLAVHDHNGNDVLEGDVPDDDDSQDGTEIRCCVRDDDDEDTECESETPEECDAKGGVNLGAGSCMPDPCAATPPPPGDMIVCCKPEDDEPECEIMSPAECSSENGINIGTGTCDPNPCAAAPPPAGTVRCCVPDDDDEERECRLKSSEECAARGGVDLGPGMCVPDPCVSSAGGAFGDDDHQGDEQGDD